MGTRFIQKFFLVGVRKGNKIKLENIELCNCNCKK